MDVAQLFHDHYQPLFRYLSRLTGDRDAASDAAQETFVRLLERASNADVQRAWLYTVGTNIVLATARTHARRFRIMARSPESAPVGAAPRDAHEAMESAERRRTVSRALASIPAKQRVALLMREEGFSHREIARSMDITVGSIGTLIARGLKALGDALQTDPREE